MDSEVEVELDLIKPSPYQPRVTFNLEDLKQEIDNPKGLDIYSACR